VHRPGRWRLLPALVALLSISAGCAGKDGHRSPTLAELLQAYDRETGPFFPFTASERGARQYDRLLANDISEEYRTALGALCARYGQAVRRLDAATLNDQERLTFDIFDNRLQTCLEALTFPWHLLPVNQVGRSLPSSFPVIGAGRGVHPFRTPRNYEDFLGRIDGFVVWMDTAIANMRLGVARGITQPRAVMLKVVPQLDAQIVEDPRTSMFWEPVKNLPTHFDDATRRVLTEKYLDAIQHRIVPAYRRLRTFIQDEYLPRCRTSYGLRDLPGGRDMYASAIRVSTTTTLTPGEIYDLGLQEVQRIQGEIDRLRAEIDPSRDAPLTRYRDVGELLKGYADLRTAVEAALPRLFGRFPRAGYEVRPIEAYRERSMPSAYDAASLDGSRPGVFYLNAAGVRGGAGVPVYPSLFLHEAVPGHHFQITLQRENQDLPGFRRFAWYNAFGEGWALYAEALGDDLGVYENRRDRLNMLQAERFRAARLVVDVGLHERGWTRQQAIDYLGGSRDDAEREAERYMAWPGQALGYKIGQLKILAVRRKAEAALGASFDIRAFHDELLRDGAMPLFILEAKMDRWIAAQRRRSGS
jgi:uncharacterized protein (DUF885 family)